MYYVNKILSLLERCCLIVGAICLIAIMSLTTIDMLSRKFLHFTIPSLFEFTEDYLMVGLVFLTLSYVYVIGGHVRVDLFERFIPTKLRLPWAIAHKVLTLILISLITVEGWQEAVQAFNFNVVSSSLLAYPMGPALLLVPIGCGMLALRVVQDIVHSLTTRSRADSVKKSEMPQ